MAKMKTSKTQERLKLIKEKALSFDEIKKSVEEASSFVRGLWITFVSLQTYFLIIAFSVTHEQIFKESPIKLPLIDVFLPFWWFAWVAPLFFLIFHIYLLLQVIMLTGKVRHYNLLLNEIDTPEIRRAVRLHLPNDVIVQMLAAPKDQREGLIGFIIRRVCWLTLFGGPLFLYLIFQYKFLPYQEDSVTITQRCILLLDCIFLLCVWQCIVKEVGAPKFPSFKTFFAIPSYILSILAIFISWFALTFPEDIMEQNLPFIEEWHNKYGILPIDSYGFKIGVAPTFYQPWLISTLPARRIIVGTLKLTNLNLNGEEKEQPKELFEVEGHLEPYNKIRSFEIRAHRQFKYADFYLARMERAQLTWADFSGSNFIRVKMAAVRAMNSKFNRASFAYSDMRHSAFSGSQFNDSQWFGCDFSFSELVSTHIVNSHLLNVNLNYARINASELTKTIIENSQLKFAMMSELFMPLTQILDSNLTGAIMNDNYMVGVKLTNVNLSSAFFINSKIYGSSLEVLGKETAYLSDHSTDKPSFFQISEKTKEPEKFDLTTETINSWSAISKKSYLSEPQQARIHNHFMFFKLNSNSEKKDAEHAKAFEKLQKESQSLKNYTRKMGLFICSKENAPHVARAIINNQFGYLDEGRIAIAKKMRSAKANPSACEGVKGFTEKDWERLDAVSPR